MECKLQGISVYDGDDDGDDEDDHEVNDADGDGAGDDDDDDDRDDDDRQEKVMSRSVCQHNLLKLGPKDAERGLLPMMRSFPEAGYLFK